MELIRETLDNGLPVFFVVKNDVPVISYQTWVRAGSRDEDPNATGVAHFLEHLMFAGTKKFPAGAFDAAVDNLGGETNAATWTDWTMYHSELPKAGLSKIVELEADRCLGLTLNRAAFERERTVILSERTDTVDNDPGERARERLWKKALPNFHPYRWLTIGARKHIEALTPKDVRTFHRRNYSAKNMHLVLAGDINPRAALKKLNQAYGELRRGRDKRLPALRKQRQRRKTFESSSTVEMTSSILLGYDAPSYLDDAWLALALFSELAFFGGEGVFTKKLVNQKELVTTIGGGAAPFKETSLFEVDLELRADVKIGMALKLFDDTLKQFLSKPSKADLESAKIRFELSRHRQNDRVYRMAERVGFSYALSGDPHFSAGRMEKLRALDVAQVRDVVAEYLDPGRRAIIALEAGKKKPAARTRKRPKR